MPGQQPGFQYPWQQQLPPQPPRKSHLTRNIVLSAAGAVVAIIVIAAVASSGNGSWGSPSSNSSYNPGNLALGSSPAAQQVLPQYTDPNGQNCARADEGPNGYCPGDSPNPPPQQYTASQQSAIQRAQDNLSSGEHFSYQGLIDQLEFDKFSADEAAFAVNHITVDWNQQAAGKAQDYMNSIGGFSCGSLVSQLEFDKFTPAQAQYGAN